ncbi:DUF222 domain-containing protein [Cellulomonas sp. ATA003]|nr:DUF222 domain-containing protein [Cellulomonas sp. ATA003]WNB85375.1 DUF222 domain-containing protein [Cellulomonas sp. ATA003]
MAGEVTVEQAQVIATLAPTSEQRRELLADPEHECNKTLVVEQARQLSVDETRVLVRHWAAYADPDADDRGYVDSCDRERLDIARLGDGYRVEGQLTAEHGQALKAALAAVTPVPAADDDRTSSQRRAHALGDVAQVVLDNGLAGTGRAVRPVVTVLVDYPTLAALVTAADTRPRQGSLLDDAGSGDGASDEGPSRTPPVLTKAMLTGQTVAGGPSAVPNERLPEPGAQRSSPATNTADIPRAPHHPSSARRTMSNNGHATAERRAWTTASCCAHSTTGRSTTATSPFAVTTADGSSPTATGRRSIPTGTDRSPRAGGDPDQRRDDGAAAGSVHPAAILRP